MNKSGHMTFNQHRGLITSPAFETREEASRWFEELQGSAQAVNGEIELPDSAPFDPAHWGATALQYIGADSQEEVMRLLKHLNPEIVRNKPVKVSKIHGTWGPFANSDGADKYVVVLVADFECTAAEEPASDPMTNGVRPDDVVDG